VTKKTDEPTVASRVVTGTNMPTTEDFVAALGYPGAKLQRTLDLHRMTDFEARLILAVERIAVALEKKERRTCCTPRTYAAILLLPR